MGDIDLLLTEIKRSQVDRRRAAFLSFYICFADRGRWEAAAAAAVAQQWQVASYSQAGSYVLRMSYSCKPTAERLQHLNDVVTAFADEQGGRWESLAIETAEPAGKWAQVADRFVPPVEAKRPRAAAEYTKPRRRSDSRRSA